jgi:hypothetical protein
MKTSFAVIWSNRINKCGNVFGQKRYRAIELAIITVDGLRDIHIETYARKKIKSIYLFIPGKVRALSSITIIE